MGRTFTEEETMTPVENHGVAILTDAYWRQRLNSDPNVLGREIRVNGVPERSSACCLLIFASSPPKPAFSCRSRSQLEQRTPKQRHSGGGGTQ